MSGLTGWVRNLRARWSESRARKRQRDAENAYARQGSDPNPPVARRHGESHSAGYGGGDGGGGGGASGG
jgi:hypothetical protein